jgi:hypothetical protein
MSPSLFQLKTSSILQGDFQLKSWNLMLVFQVNCPGCFVYAFPVANQIHKFYARKDLKVLGLSTAFEDFEFNTQKNTQLLLDEGEIVGETKKTLGRSGHRKLPFKISFDVAFDLIEEHKITDLTKEAQDYCQHIPDFSKRSAQERDLIEDQVKAYLRKKDMSPYTFDKNNLLGTPSWILFDHEMNVSFQAFGHKEYAELKEAIDKVV